MEDTNKDSLGDNIIAAIKSGKAKMRPKWYFMVRNILDITAVVIVFLILVYLVSFVVFALHQTGAWFATDFGAGGWYSLFNSLPWLLVGLSAVFILLLAFLLKQYPWGYEWPLIYVFLAILFIIVAGVLLITHTSISYDLFNTGQNQEMPFLGGIYGGFGVPTLDTVHRGLITEITPVGFVMEGSLAGGDVSGVIVASSTVFIPARSVLALGDIVVVVGDRNASGTIQAQGIEEITQQEQ